MPTDWLAFADTADRSPRPFTASQKEKRTFVYNAAKSGAPTSELRTNPPVRARYVSQTSAEWADPGNGHINVCRWIVSLQLSVSVSAVVSQDSEATYRKGYDKREEENDDDCMNMTKIPNLLFPIPFIVGKMAIKFLNYMNLDNSLLHSGRYRQQTTVLSMSIYFPILALLDCTCPC